VLWIARLQPWKQPQLFIELLKGICNKPYRFCAIGRASGQEHYEKLFKKAETEYPQFSYLGEISHQQVLNLLQQAKLLVSTAESEGFSNTFIEAWLCGVPVLSLTVDPDDLIKVEKLGKITSDIEQMQQELEKFMTDDTYYLQYSNHCRTFAEKNFNISQTVSQLEKLLNSLQ
jgi:glycosyltransferase involved in cell wall biosynthesis